MKLDEFSFLNQQLAGMLRDGIPLEGALRQLCKNMKRGQLRDELEKLEADLARGVPLTQALLERKLPQLYVNMVQVGVASNDLPGVLTLLADYYQKVNSIGTRLTGLMVYPVFVLFGSLALSIWMASILSGPFKSFTGDVEQDANRPRWVNLGKNNWVLRQVSNPPSARLNFSRWVSLWLPPVILGAAAGAACIALGVPQIRRVLRWRLPAFREASLSQLSSTMGMMLKSGCTLSDAIALARQLEQGTRAGRELARWQQRCEAGHGKFIDLAEGSKVFPPLFVWLVASGGEDLTTGFSRATEVYYARAQYRIELLLYATLPITLLLLGLMIIGQIYPFLVFIYHHYGQGYFNLF